MKPTMKLKWFYSETKREPHAFYHSHGDTYTYVLKQWWEDSTGNGEWRFIDVEH